MFLVLGHSYPYADIDSILSSVIFAEIWTALGYPAQAVNLNPNGIKKSALVILAKIGNIELPSAATKAQLEKADLILVDHNQPDESYGKLGLIKKPYMIIDHHTDSGFAAEQKIIAQVGSTCTLIAEFSREKGVQLSKRQARALAFGILNDTKALRGAKTSERDRQMLAHLYREYTIDETVETISAIVFQPVNVQTMPVQDILCSSMKEYQNGKIAIAAIEVADDAYQDRLEEITDHGCKMGYELYILMITKYHIPETEILYFDSAAGCAIKTERRKGLVSRGKELVPEILARRNSFLPSKP